MKPGKSVAVLGGQWIGMAVAQYLAEEGSQVTVIEQTAAIAQDLEFMAQQAMNARLATSNQISVRLNTNVEKITATALTLQSEGEISVLAEIDQVVFAIERTMECDLEHMLAESGVLEDVAEVYAIGDCVFPGHPYEAVNQAFSLARTI